MDGQVFARQLSAWLDPGRLLSLARDYARTPEELEQRGTATREATSFAAAADVGLDQLIRTFIEHFTLSDEFLEVLQGGSRVALDDRARARLSGLRFTGDVAFEQFDSSSPAGTVAAFTGPRLEILTIAGPINFLIRLVDGIAAMWSPLPRDKGFYEPSFHTELAVYIEAAVAHALGFKVDAAWTSGRPGLNSRPINGVMTMVGSPPFDRGAAVDIWAKTRGRPVPPARAAIAGTDAVFENRDGVLILDPKTAAAPWHNTEHFRNECSPLSGVEAPDPRTDDQLLVDSQYGRAFDFILTDQSAVYGFSQDLAQMNQPTELGYLRVPYRLVPRIRARSRDEVERIVNSVRSQLAGSFVETRVLLRGQSQEYFLGRSPAALQALFGDPSALEPSLPASSARKRQPLEEALPEWCLLIRSYLLQLHILLMNDGPSDQSERLSAVMQADRVRLESSLDTHTLAFSLAQHYGLPSMGLDLTDQLGTALFFALHRFERSDGRKLRVVPHRGEDAVLYIFVLPERFCVEHARARPGLFPRGRPDAQVAWFSHMGWGYRKNQCAEYLVAAVYLDPDADYGPLPTAEELFPAIADDPFGAFMESVLAEGWMSPTLRQYIGQLYWLER